MRFMNEGEIEAAARRYRHHPILGPATQTLSSLCLTVNINSDGWHSWPQPVRAAARLMDLIEGDGRSLSLDPARMDATVSKLKASYTPIKSFRTRCLKEGIKLDFEIVPAREGAYDSEIVF
jgi:hypothetical protein